MLIGSYSTSLVVISLCVAILATYTALDLAGRIATAKGRAVYLWITGGAVAMGVGIWSMHFIGMLALRLPFALGFEVGITLLSLLIAVLSSGFALWLVSQPRLPAWQLAFGALVMGAGIASMHYTGMAAMRMTPSIEYDPALFGASLLIAVVASGAALWIAFNLRRNTPYVRLALGGAAVVMGVADPVLGHAIAALVVLSDASLSERDIIRHCAAHLEDFMVPKIVEFRSELPKTDTGKVSRRLAAETLGAAE